jgi:hypothetical protein
MGHAVAGYGTHLADFQRRDRSCVAVERDELHLVRLAVGIDVDHSPHITWFESFSGN